MKTFTDADDRKWTVAIDIPTARRVRDELDIDLLSALDGELLQRLSRDTYLLVDLLYVLCQEQAVAAGVTDQAFGSGIRGDAIDAATDAFLQALTDFFPRRERAVLAQVSQKSADLKDLATAEIQAKLASGQPEQLLRELMAKEDRTIRDRLGLTGGSGSMGSPVLPGSPSAPAPG